MYVRMCVRWERGGCAAGASMGGRPKLRELVNAALRSPGFIIGARLSHSLSQLSGSSCEN